LREAGRREKRNEERGGERRWGGKRRAVAEVSNSMYMYERSVGHVAVVCALFMYTPVKLLLFEHHLLCTVLLARCNHK